VPRRTGLWIVVAIVVVVIAAVALAIAAGGGGGSGDLAPGYRGFIIVAPFSAISPPQITENGATIMVEP